LYTGKITNYNVKAGWGFVLPDDPDTLPEDVQTAMTDSVRKAEEAGKKPGDPNLIYFRKPDLAEGFKATRDAAVTFELYTDDKGVGAYNISSAE